MGLSKLSQQSLSGLHVFTCVHVFTFQQIYSRVVRICKRDHGGGGPFFSDNFVTFLKARIYCSYTRAGQSPYDFNEIGACYFELSYYKG